MARKPKKLKTKRIYYGPPGKEKTLWWDVTVTPAKRDVTINGEVMHALRATEGVTIGCAFSNMATDNHKEFPHPVYLASFSKATALLVNRLKRNGEPRSAVLYHHHYSHITDANDDGTLKRMVKEDPTIVTRKFILKIPRSPPKGKPAKAPRIRRSGHGESFVPRGALARAVRASRVGPHVARQITEVAARAE